MINYVFHGEVMVPKSFPTMAQFGVNAGGDRVTIGKKA
jgi:hypothetical protein